MRVLVTGASGTIGAALCDALLVDAAVAVVVVAMVLVVVVAMSIS